MIADFLESGKKMATHYVSPVTVTASGAVGCGFEPRRAQE